MRDKTIITKILLIIIILSSFVVAGIVWEPVFDTNDDRTMQEIISGNLTGEPDGHAVFIMYPLAKALSMLYKVAPMLPWYGLFSGMCLMYSAYIITSEIIFFEHKNSIIKKFFKILALCLMLGIFINCFIYQQFTVLAGALGATSVFLVVLKKRKVSICILLFLCLMVRSDVFLMTCPFILAGVLWNCVYDDTKYLSIIKKCISVGIILIVVLISANLINNIFYSDDEWKCYEQYNSARSRLYDYTEIRTNSEYKYGCIEGGVSEDEYNLISSYNLLLDKNITKDRLEAVKAIVQQEEQSDTFVIKIIKNIYNLIHVWLIQYWKYSITIILLYALIIWLIKEKKKYKNMAIIFCVFGGKNIILFYLLWQGRFVPRVFRAMYLIEILFLLAIMIKMLTQERKNATAQSINNRHMVIGWVFISIFVCSILLQSKDIIRSRNGIDKLNKTMEYVKDYAENKDNMYLLDINSFDLCTSYVYRMNSSKKNVWYMEPWLTNSPLVIQKLKKMGEKDCGELLYKSSGTFLIIKSEQEYDWMNDYFSDRFGNCKLVKEDVIKYSNDIQYDVIKIDTLDK